MFPKPKDARCFDEGSACGTGHNAARAALCGHDQGRINEQRAAGEMGWWASWAKKEKKQDGLEGRKVWARAEEERGWDSAKDRLEVKGN